MNENDMVNGALRLNSALLAYQEESTLYCRGINDNVAREFAVEYARMIEYRARGLDAPPPVSRHQLFAPSRRLICQTLERIYQKHFSSGLSA
jgi:hypothetical protein